MDKSSGSARRSRNDSPAPKSKAGAKAAPVPVKKPAEPEKKEPEKKEPQICGLHPEAFWALVFAPLAVVGVLTCALFLDVGANVISFVHAYWSTISVPTQKFLQANVDSILKATFFTTFSPLIFVGVVTIWRATMDLGYLNWWQQAGLIVLVGAALATVDKSKYLFIFDQVKMIWDKVSDPIEALLATKADTIIAGAAICCLAPIAAAMVMYGLQMIWGCRLKLVTEPIEEEKKASK
jgi:hypothetical protein